MNSARGRRSRLTVVLGLGFALAVSAAGTPAPAAAAASDSASAAAVPLEDPLLPDKLGPGERMLWGEGGLMRITGLYPLTEESRERELRLRRGMLTAHQVGGFLTLASMIATSYCGQMIINGETGYADAKSTLIVTTIAGYFTTAALSLLAPPPVIRRKGWSSVSAHKALAWVHFTGMIVTPILGGMIEEDADARRFHQVSGYATTAAFAGAMLVMTF